MENLSQLHLLGAAAILLLMLVLGALSGRRVKNAADFATGGGSSGALLVAGTITGTLVGGSSTIGAAQLAFHYGFSAWWFTLGGALGCLILALGLAKPLRAAGQGTIQQLIQKEFGPAAGLLSSVLATLGLGLNIVSQLLSANVLLASIFGFGPLLCTLVSAACMACYVIFGGVRGTGLLGIVKTLLLSCSVLAGGAIALSLAGGPAGLLSSLPRRQYFSLFARGVGTDLGAGLSVMLGVISTQTYIQAVLSGRSLRAARGGTLLSALMIPVIGVGSILVGCYMQTVFPAMDAGQALPRFVIGNLPPFLGGIVLGTLFLAVVGTGSGLALGLSTVVTNNLYKRFHPDADSRRCLRFSRGVILVTLALAAAFTFGNLRSAILTWGFLSMGLRAAVLLAPMCAALFFPGRVRPPFACASSVFGVLATLAGSLLSLPGDSLFWGVGAGVLVLGLGALPKSASGGEAEG